MIFVLEAESDQFPVKSYIIDGTSANTFSATIIVTAGLVPSSIGVSSTNGFVNLTGISIEGNLLKGVQGNFKVNFTDGGVGQGSFNTAAQ